MHNTMRLCALLCALALATALPAQDRAGNDTPGEWIVDHQQAFGLWDSVCDHRTTGEVRERRCYLRYVAVFSARPKFAAQFVFVTPEPKIEFGTEPGTLFARNGFRIEQEGIVTWRDPKPGCLVGLACIFEDAEAKVLLSAMARGGAFAFDFTDRHGQPQNLRWDLAPFADALADHHAQSAQRGL